MRRFAGFAAISPEQGALTSIYLASSPDVESISGRYFVKHKPRSLRHSATRMRRTARQLWDISEELLGPY